MVILGQMGELGNVSQEEHQRVINLLRDACFDQVWLVGSEWKKAIAMVADTSASLQATLFNNVEEVKDAIRSHQPNGYCILIKGSNAVRLYELPDLL